MDVITSHRLQMLGLESGQIPSLPIRERLAEVYRVYLDRVPYENLSNSQACCAAPGEPESWPRTTDRFLRENRSCGLGGTSFTLAYALRDLFRGIGANAHCALGHNLVTEEAHAVVVVYFPDESVLFDPALLISGPVPIRPGGVLEDPLGTITLRPRSGPTLTLCLQMVDMPQERSVYSIIPVPTPPPAFRQAWVASFYRGHRRPLTLARRVGNEIRRYGERPQALEILTCSGRTQRVLEPEPVEDLHRMFGIARECLQTWFENARRND
ncbi:MAG: hypothetical protein ACYTG6_00155 [Planctomycetota bacterium]|jgi:hypothetical protein